MKIKKADERIINASENMRYLLSRGYSRRSALSVIANRYGLSKREQMALYRGVYDSATIKRRVRKRAHPSEVRNAVLAVDWYNVYITVDSAFSGEIVISSDDTFLRDVRGLHGKGMVIESGRRSVDLIMRGLRDLGPREVLIFLDAVVSRSGEARKLLSEEMQKYGLKGAAHTVKSPDTELTEYDLVATSDGVVIDRSRGKIIDLAWYVLKDEDIEAICLI